jgi:hypothetical protein
MVGVALLAVVSVAVGGLIAGAWKLEDLRPPVVSPVPTAALACSVVGSPAASMPTLSVAVYDSTGLLGDGCSFVGGLPHEPMTRTDVRVVNLPPSKELLQVMWLVSSCDTGATIRFSGQAPSYQLVVERHEDGPCTSVAESFAVELVLSNPVPAEEVVSTMVGDPRPKP